MSKVMKAVIALGGDLRNTRDYAPNERVLSFWKGEYLTFNFESLCDNYICTVDEFNAAADQWRKHAYMHNAAIDLDWDIENVVAENGSWLAVNYDNTNNEYVGYFLNERNISNFANIICTEQEFIDYCEANNPKHDAWSIHTNTNPLKDLTNEQAAELFNWWRNGGKVEFCVSDYQWDRCPAPKFYKGRIYRAAKPKSERELFVDFIVREINYNNAHKETVIDVAGQLFDSGKFKLVE